MRGAALYRVESESRNKINASDFSCRAKQNQHRISTCRKHKRTQIVSRDNHSELSSIDLGVERVKVVRRKKIIVYLPENKGLNVTKILSSKCVGGVVADTNEAENLNNNQKIDKQNAYYELNIKKIDNSDIKIKKDHYLNRKPKNGGVIEKLSKFNKEDKKVKNISLKTNQENRSTSNSSIERVYNLESSTSNNSKIVTIFNEDNLKDCNSLSLKRNSVNSGSEKRISDPRHPTTFDIANEILKQGLCWVRESSKDLIGGVSLNKTIHKNVSVTSSPPSLISRSLSSTKNLGKTVSVAILSKTKVDDLHNINNCTKEESKVEDVKTMFKLWEKKFNFENESNVSNLSKIKIKELNEMDKIKDIESKDTQEHKKCKNIFSFFRKKNKEKKVLPLREKKITAGRCELSDGIIIKIGSIKSSAIKKTENIKDNKQIMQQSWLKKFLTRSEDSQKSVKLRWDNKFYSASSNTILEIKNYDFYEPNVSFKNDNQTRNVNFPQSIKACMMPNAICQIPINKCVPLQDDDRFLSNNCKKFRKKSKNLIEIFLPANNISRDSNKSSDYITIHIPEEYFSNDSEHQTQYTDEEVCNIVEYESRKSKNILKDESFGQKLYVGDYNHYNTQKQKQTTIQTCNEVVIQGNNVCSPKVLEVGIRTQRDTNCLKKTKKLEKNSKESQYLQPQRKCDLAETYLRDYCRSIVPLDLGLFTSHNLSKSQWQSTTSNSSSNCSSCDLYTENNVVSSKSSTEQGSESSKITECKQVHTNEFFSKLRKKSCDPLPPCNIRTCPKDSIEVWKKRKIYACSNKSKWGDNSTKESTETDSKSTPLSTASFDENCMDPCTAINNRPLDGILKFKGISDCSNCKNEKLTNRNATVIPDPICQIPKPPCLEKCSSVKNPICIKTSSPTCHARSPECFSPKSKVSKAEASKTKVTQIKSPQGTISNTNYLNAVASDSKPELKEVPPITCFCSGDENIVPIAESIHTLKDNLISPPICPLDPNSYCCCKPNHNSLNFKSNANLSPPCENKITTTTFYQKSLINVKRKKCNCIGKKNVLTTKCASNDPNCNIDKKKDSGNILDAKQSKDLSKELENSDGRIIEKSSDLREVNNDIEKEIDNRKSVTSKSESSKEKTDKIDGVNGDEVVREKSNKIKDVNYDEVLKDVYKDPCDVTNTPIQAKKQKSSKSLDDNTLQRKLSVSDIIEINICLKFRNPETSKTKIRPDHAYKVEEKSVIQNIKIGSAQNSQINKNEDNHILGHTEDINFTINIQTVKPISNLSNEYNNSYATRPHKRDNSIKSSEHFLHDHQPILDFTNATDKFTFTNKQIANFETSNGTDNFVSLKITHSSLTNENNSKVKSNVTTDNVSDTSEIPWYNKQQVINERQGEYQINKEATNDESIEDIVNRKLVSILKKLSKNDKKTVFKQILETVGNMQCKNKRKKVKKIKHLMYAVLAPESDIIIKHINNVKSKSTSSTGRQILTKSNSFLSNKNMITDKCFDSSTISRQENSKFNEIGYVSSNLKKKDARNIDYNHTGCCCSKKVDIGKNNCCCNTVNIETKPWWGTNIQSDKNICCCSKKVKICKEISVIDQSYQNNEDNNDEKATQNLNLQSIIMTKMSTIMQIKSKMVSTSTKKVTNISSAIKQAKQDKFVYLASDKVLFFLSDSNDSKSHFKRKQYSRPEDILQLRKTKRAVLKIYLPRLSCSVIELPNFVSHTQCLIRPNKNI